MSDLAAKIKHGWGYDVGQFPPNVVLEDAIIDEQAIKRIAHWPTDTPPTIAEIEAIELPPDPTLRHIAPYDFQSRFTDAELVAIQTSVDPLIIRGRTMLQTIITYIDLDLQQTQDLIGYMAVIELIEPERVAEILA